MKALKRIALTELQVMFYSPIAWFILIVFMVQAAMAYCGAFETPVKTQDLGYAPYDVTAMVYASSWGGFFTSIQSYLYLYIPLLTMGIMSRELSTGSIKLLYSSPVTNFQIIFGKFLAVAVYALAMAMVMVGGRLYAKARAVKRFI
jgi:ABC-2 type transport system permease protein